MKKILIGSLLLSTIILGGTEVNVQKADAAEVTPVVQKNNVNVGQQQLNVAKEKVNALFYDLGYVHTGALKLDISLRDLLDAQKEVAKLQTYVFFHPQDKYIKSVASEVKALMDSANKMFYTGEPEVFNMAKELIYGFFTDVNLTTPRENITDEEWDLAFYLLKDTETYGTAYMNAHNGDEKYLNLHYELSDLVDLAMNCF